MKVPDSACGNRQTFHAPPHEIPRLPCTKIGCIRPFCVHLHRKPDYHAWWYSRMHEGSLSAFYRTVCHSAQNLLLAYNIEDQNRNQG